MLQIFNFEILFYLIFYHHKTFFYKVDILKQRHVCVAILGCFMDVWLNRALNVLQTTTTANQR